MAQDLAPAGAVMGGSRETLRFAQSIKVKVAASYKAQIAAPLQIKRITQDYSVRLNFLAVSGDTVVLLEPPEDDPVSTVLMELTGRASLFEGG